MNSYNCRIVNNMAQQKLLKKTLIFVLRFIPRLNIISNISIKKLIIAANKKKKMFVPRYSFSSIIEYEAKVL